VSAQLPQPSSLLSYLVFLSSSHCIWNSQNISLPDTRRLTILERIWKEEIWTEEQEEKVRIGGKCRHWRLGQKINRLKNTKRISLVSQLVFQDSNEILWRKWPQKIIPFRASVCEYKKKKKCFDNYVLTMELLLELSLCLLNWNTTANYIW